MKANTRQTTNLLKKHFLKEYGAKVSIRSEKYSMGSSLRVSYILGPDESYLKPIINSLQYGYFNGMEDIYEHVEKDAVVLDGYELEDFKYTRIEQEIPEGILYLFAKAASDALSISGVPKLENKEQMHESFTERWGSACNWSQLLYQHWKIRNFNTQNPEDITDVKLVEGFNNDDGFKFSYHIGDKEYRTDEYIKPTQEKPSVNPVSVPKGEIQIIEYSEKAIAVIGETKPIKDKLKDLGGRFNFRLSCGSGWIFPKSKMEILIQTLSKNV